MKTSNNKAKNQHNRDKKVNNPLSNCWEFWDCNSLQKKNCFVYKNNLGRQCWTIAGSLEAYPGCPKCRRKFEYCWDCPFFKRLNPGFVRV